MLTMNEVINELASAKTKKFESLFLNKFFKTILEYADNGASQGYAYFDEFDNRTDFDMFVKIVKTIAEETYTVKNVITEIDDSHKKDYVVDVYFDLKKKTAF